MLDAMFYGPRQKKYAAINCTAGGAEGESGLAAAQTCRVACNCRVFYCQILELERLRLTSNICQATGANRDVRSLALYLSPSLSLSVLLLLALPFGHKFWHLTFRVEFISFASAEVSAEAKLNYI